jgi:hypothetical protein
MTCGRAFAITPGIPLTLEDNAHTVDEYGNTLSVLGDIAGLDMRNGMNGKTPRTTHNNLFSEILPRRNKRHEVFLAD